MSSQFKWWQSAVFYQIYPRSFADGNGDGMGDFQGMLDKLDYLKELGVDAVWLSPHFPSPYIDCGYDISDYEDVAPEYGDLKTFKKFLDGLHERGMHLILDLVMNHTSDKHQWFIESSSSKDNPKRDWYIWKPGKEGNPPTNWYSTFGGSAWEYDEKTGEYYYHFFFKEQPDLNWNNPEVRKAMFDSVRFWLDMGVDGFRLDAVGTIFEDERYLDHEAKMDLGQLMRLERTAETTEEKLALYNNWKEMFKYQIELPGVHQIMRELRLVINEYEDRVLVGETDEIAYYGNGDDELHLNFNFPMMKVPYLTAEHVRNNQKERLSQLPAGAWPCNTLGNHDVSRMYTHFGDGKHNEQQVRLNLTLLLTLKGTPFLYNGEEIGMSDYFLTDSASFRDSLAFSYYQMAKDLLNADEATAISAGAEHGRDKCRTPLQWSNEENAGFSPKNVIPWLPVNSDYRQGVNVVDQMKQSGSLWRYYQTLLALRKGSEALKVGEYRLIEETPTDVLAFSRFTAGEEVIILLNFSDSEKSVKIETGLSLLLETKPNQSIYKKGLATLTPFAAVVLQK